MNRGRSLLEQTVTGRTRILEDVHLGPRPGLLIRVFDTIEAEVARAWITAPSDWY